jgi:hypothetical protein
MVEGLLEERTKTATLLSSTDRLPPSYSQNRSSPLSWQCHFISETTANDRSNYTECTIVRQVALRNDHTKTNPELII